MSLFRGMFLHPTPPIRLQAHGLKATVPCCQRRIYFTCQWNVLSYLWYFRDISFFTKNFYFILQNIDTIQNIVSDTSLHILCVLFFLIPPLSPPILKGNPLLLLCGLRISSFILPRLMCDQSFMNVILSFKPDFTDILWLLAVNTLKISAFLNMSIWI